MRVVFIFFSLFLLLGCGDGADSLAHLGVCDGYPDPASSNYILPWSTGQTELITQGNCSPVSHNSSQRYAYDIGMDIGTSIVASRAGTVLEIEESFTDGSACPNNNFVYIEHADGSVAAYFHLTKNGALVNAGDSITQGQPIALSGNTGCSTGAHLHFVVFKTNRKEKSIPVTFSNSSKSNIRGLLADTEYTAL